MKMKLLAYTAALAVCPLFADNVLHPGTPVLDRPTLTVLGIQLPISGDDNFSASVAVRYRPTGTTAWSQGLPLFRVHPENTVLYNVMPQFAGSIFNLQPGTSYDIALDITDVNGHVSQTLTLTGATRQVPSDPAPLRVVNVTDVPSLKAALGSAQAGDLIQIANGNYQGSFFGIQASGTPQNPIVIRGASEENTVLDGGNCTPCNVLEVYGSYVHVEQLSLRNAERALRFQGIGSTANVVRYVHISNTSLGIGSQANQTDYYIADNILEGVLAWPHVYADDQGLYASNDGINVQGNGHVVAHNTISGYGDAMKTSQQGDRADDFYGNDILWTYDNGIELDASEGNTRCFRNRFTNAWDTLSVQPILGGPAYLFRNIVVNAADEQMKFHAVNTTPPQEPNGVLAYHNTFVSPNGDLYLCTPNTSHHFWIENNLFVGPPSLVNKAVMWCGPVDDGHFDYDGYWPDGPMSWNLPVPGGYAFFNWPNFAAVQAGGLETHGLILNGQIFANGLVGMPTYTNRLSPQDVSLAYGSPALDRGLILPNINDGYTGAGPDLGALESGCPQPSYGPRPAGVDETNEPIGCASSSQPPPAPAPVSISISPTSVTLTASQSQTFTASVNGGGDASVSWSIAPAGVGTFSDGVYTAPGSITASQTISITATSHADATKSATASVTLQPPPPAPVSISISPTSATLTAGQSQTFTASVSGGSDASVTWSVAPAGIGTFSNGVYTAPSSVTASQTITITATSNADATKSAAANVTLQPTPAPTPDGPPGNVSLGISPGFSSLGAGQSLQFTATVTGSSNTAVRWSISPPSGQISSNGLYTAPSSVASVGRYHHRDEPR